MSGHWRAVVAQKLNSIVFVPSSVSNSSEYTSELARSSLYHNVMRLKVDLQRYFFGQTFQIEIVVLEVSYAANRHVSQVVVLDWHLGCRLCRGYYY